MVYVADTVTRTCFAGPRGETLIDCQAIARDAVMRPYINWLPPSDQSR